jgi:hypothetical protein
MGLKIAEFKKGGSTFTDAYAKVGNVRYDNDSKIANFGVKVLVSKEDKNEIAEMRDQWVKVAAGVDMVGQCYAKITTIIAQANAMIVARQATIDAIVDNDNLKLREENMLNQLKANELLQLTGGVEW